MIPDYSVTITDPYRSFKHKQIFWKSNSLQTESLFRTNNCLYPFQFGFWLNYSNNNLLMALVESIQKVLDAGKYTTGVFADLKRPLAQWITTFY